MYIIILQRLKELNDTERNRTLTENRFGVHLIANPRNYDYNAFNLNIQQLRQNPQNQYNLVCNVLMEVCGVSKKYFFLNCIHNIYLSTSY